MQWYNKATNVLQSKKPGANIVSQEYWDSLYSEWTQIADDFTLPTPIEQLKKSKESQMKLQRDTLESSGFPYLSKVFDSDAKSIQRLSIAVQAATTAVSQGQSLSFNWTTADNSVLTMTAEELLGLPIALAGYANELHQKYRAIKEAIESCTSKEELEAIQWTNS